MLRQCDCMKFLILLLFCLIAKLSAAQTQNANKQDALKKRQVVEASCGQCQFGLPGKSCDLAVRIGGKSYFVEGSHIDSHGDAHADDGFCNAIRKAEVQGEIVNNRFKATYFKLIKPEVKEEKKNL